MTPERAAELVTAWVRCYTRRLPAAVAERRLDEIGADLHDHIGHERAAGTTDRRITLSVLSRLVRGVAADTAWRNHIRPWKEDLVKSFAANLAVALVLVVVGVAAMVYGGEDDAPGLVLIGLLFVAGAAFLGVRALYRRRQGAGRP
jgi:hypothetical protein